MVQIAQFELTAVKHPTDADDSELTWKVLIKVKFQDEDPANWGEFRAYGAAWTRIINRTHEIRDITEDGPPKRMAPGTPPRRKEVKGQLVQDTTLPFWGLTGPQKGKSAPEWRLGIDQHMDILYADIVPGVPRSDPKSKTRLPDDDNKPTNIRTVSDPGDFAGLKTKEWHIIARDEPTYGPVQQGDFVEYWHRGEFRVRDPKTQAFCPQRKQLWCRVRGLHPDFTYEPHIDNVVDDAPPSWETYIWDLRTRDVVTYPVRGMTVHK
jgi:hypothetical protein